VSCRTMVAYCLLEVEVGWCDSVNGEAELRVLEAGANSII